MKRLIPLLVFLIVALGGVAGLLLFRKEESAAKRRPPAPVPQAAAATASRTVFPPLRFPPEVTVSRGTGDGWENSGELNANFVSARGRLNAWFQNQSWRPEKQITLDASLEPRVLLTFSQGKTELIVMFWKISTDRTGFSCRRGLKEEPTGGILP